MEENLKRLGISGHDDELTDTTVEGLGGLVGTLFELFVVGRLLNKVKNLVGELRRGEWECLGVDSFGCGYVSRCLFVVRESWDVPFLISWRIFRKRKISDLNQWRIKRRARDKN